MYSLVYLLILKQQIFMLTVKYLLSMCTFVNKYLDSQYIALFPHKFLNSPLISDMSSIINELSSLLPQLSGFISQFNEVINNTGINVVSDSAGNLSIDVPKSMSDIEASNLSKRIGIIDRLIATRSQEIHDLVQEGLKMEKSFHLTNPNYTSQLSEKLAEFNRLKGLYKH